MDLEPDILEALVARVNALSLGLPVAWGNVTFAPPSDGKYIAASFMPNGNERIGITDSTPDRYRGLLQLSVYWPKGAGDVAPMQKAAEVRTGFPKDLKLTSGTARVRITKTPDVVGPLTEDHAIHVPVTISWESFA